MLKQSAVLLAGLTTVQALGQHQCIHFPSSASADLTNGGAQVVFDEAAGNPRANGQNADFLLVSTDHRLRRHGVPVLTSSKDNVAVHLAVANWVTDVEKVSGFKLEVYNDTLPSHSKSAVIVGTSSSDIVGDLKGYQGVRDDLDGKWESFDVRVLENPRKDLDHAVVISGSDRVGNSCVLRTMPDDIARHGICAIRPVGTDGSLALALLVRLSTHPS
jgi:hypothetical protein